MPNLVNPILDQTSQEGIDIPQSVDSSWQTPKISIPDSILLSQQAFVDQPGNISGPQFTDTVNNKLTPPTQKEFDKTDASLSLIKVQPIDKSSLGQEFRTFNSRDALRYKQNERLYKQFGFNPEIPADITDAIYDHHETTWESFKNVLPKLLSTTSFSYKNYFAEYADAARAIGQLDANLLHGENGSVMNKLHDSKRFDIYANEQKLLDDLNPDYATDKPTKWYQLNRGDFWEESGSSLGFTIGTIGAAMTENALIAAATMGFGEFAELPNSARKVFKAIGDYYSLKRAYGLVKGVTAAKSLTGWLGNAANIWRLTNGALSEAAFEGATNSSEYLERFKQDYIAKYGYAPDVATMKIAKKAGDDMANATILYQTPFLMASNAIQFGNLIAPKTIGKIMSKIKTDPYKFVVGDLAGGLKVGLQSTQRVGVRGVIDRTTGVLRNPLTEGMEESYQAEVTKSTADYYNDKYFHKDDLSIAKSLGAGFDYITSNEGLKEFAAGFATGSIFKFGGTPFHWAAKRSIQERNEDEQKVYREKNPNSTDIQAKYKTNFLNNTFGLGMKDINKLAEKEKYQKIADTLNSVDIEKMLTAGGIFDMIKDKKTSLALAKYLSTNDIFNINNTQNLQLNRFLFNGLTTGKLQMQIDRLLEFGKQKFDDVKGYFDLDENDYNTQEQKDAFMTSFNMFGIALQEKSKEFEKIYDEQKADYQQLFQAAGQEHIKLTSVVNMLLTEWMKKYGVDKTEDLVDKLTDVEKLQFNAMNNSLIESKMHFYGVNEGFKASIFSQEGMKYGAKRANDIVTEMLTEGTTGVQYHELGDLFTDRYRGTRKDMLTKKLADAKAETEPNEAKIEMIQEQLDTFKEMYQLLDDQFEKGKNYNPNAVADAIQRYLYSVQKEMNILDNNTSLEDRINKEEGPQFKRLIEWVKIQRQYQENLNMYNYLSNTANKKTYTEFQSFKLTEFFKQVSDLVDAEEKVPEAAPVAPAADPAKPSDPAADNKPAEKKEEIVPPVKQDEPPAPSNEPGAQDQFIKNTTSILINAVKNKNYQVVEDMKAVLKNADPNIILDLVKKRYDNGSVASFKDELEKVIREVVGDVKYDEFFNTTKQEPVTTQPPAQEPVAEPAAEPVVTEEPAEEVKPTGKISMLDKLKSMQAEQGDAEDEEDTEEDVNDFVARMKAGENMSSPEDLQFYENNKEEIEAKLAQDDEEQENDAEPEVEKTEDEILLDKINDFIDRGLIEGAYVTIARSNPALFLQEIAQQINNVGSDGKFIKDTDVRENPSVKGIDKELKNLANSMYPQYQEEADRADKERNDQLMAEPVPVNEVPPSDNDGGGAFLPPIAISGGIEVPKSGDKTNIISWLVDEARKVGRFIFNQAGPKELDTKEKDRIILRSSSESLALMNRKITEMLSKIAASDSPEDMDNFKLKLEKINKEDPQQFHAADKTSHSIVAMFVDKKGNYHYFDKQGNLTTKEAGTPFGIEYDYDFYEKNRLSESRNSLSGTMSSIEHGYGENASPLDAIYTLLAHNIPIYGSVIGVLNGTLSRYDSTNNYNNQVKPGVTPQMRSLQELFDSGDLDSKQDIDVRVNGYYIGFPDKDSEQRTKIGRPTVYDATSDLFIPLRGNKLKDVTFEGTKIDKTSQLYELIDYLDKNGKISVDTLRADKTRLMTAGTDMDELYYFLRAMLYSKNFGFSMSNDGKTIYLKRNDESPKAMSLWDAEINYVIKKRGLFLDIPFTSTQDEQGNPTDNNMDYNQFANENFFTGAVKAEITKDEIEFAKINKRIIFQLDQSYEEMADYIGKNIGDEGKISEPALHDRFAAKKDPLNTYTLIAKEGDTYTLQSDEDEEEVINITGKAFLSKWRQVTEIEKAIKVEKTPQQKETHSKLRAPSYVKSDISVTYIPRPSKVYDPSASKSTDTPATFAGNVIDNIGKLVFNGEDIDGDTVIKVGKYSGPLSSFFIDMSLMNRVINRMRNIKKVMEEDGYTFKAGLRVQDVENGLGGELDLVAVDRDGLAHVYDFKTSRGDFGESHLAQTYDGTTEKEYFATQGYMYSLMLAKQGIPVSPIFNLLGFTINYTTTDNLADTKISFFKEKENHKISFNRSDVVSHYDGLTTIKQIVDKYLEIKSQTATKIIEEDKENPKTILGIKKKNPGKLDMTIEDIHLIAATEEELRKEIAAMSEMLGEEMVVKFVREMNKYVYGTWTADGTLLYQNAIKGAGYHEGWHEFSQLYLTQEQKIRLYKAVRQEGISYINRAGEEHNTSDHDDLEIEEFLADEWAKYAQDPKSYKYPGKEKKTTIMSFFKDLWKLIKNFFNRDKSPTQLFHALYNGNLSRYKKDINNALFRNLNVSVYDDAGNEILPHTRTTLYKDATSYFIGEILAENNKSFSWLRENASSNTLKQLIYDKFVDKLNERVSKLGPVDEDRILSFPEETMGIAVKTQNITYEQAAMYIGQIQEIHNILNEDSGGFNNFITWYIQNTDLDTLVDTTDEIRGNLFDSSTVRDIISRQEDRIAMGEDDNIDEDEEGMAAILQEWNKDPNSESAYQKASKAILDFFRTIPMIKSVNEDNSFEYEMNELDVPYTHNHANVFNKAKFLLAGRFTIEKILKRLTEPRIRRDFPESVYIVNKLQVYLNAPSPENMDFIRKFTYVMCLPEVDNRQLYIDFDALQKDKKSPMEKTLIRNRSLSKTGEKADIDDWTYKFNHPDKVQPLTEITDNTSLADIFDNNSINNILFKDHGVIKLNPFFDYQSLGKMSTREFLSIFSIDVHENFWKNSQTSVFADRLKEFMIANLVTYNEYAMYNLAGELGKKKDALAEYVKSDQPNREAVDKLFNTFFIANPIQRFTDRRTYRLGDKEVATNSIYTLLQDISRQNSIFSLTASSRSFNDGSGKLKWAFYDVSRLNYMVQMLNDIDSIKEFNKERDLHSVNPNVCPWLTHTLFYQAQFDDRGNRFNVSRDLLDNKKNYLSSEKVRIELADLSSYQTKRDGTYDRVHPKELSGQDKLFFDMMTLLTDGFIEIPRAETSSTIMAIKLNSYDAKRLSKGFTKQFLPIAVTSVGIFRSNSFRSAMQGYLIGELQKLNWYFNYNPNTENVYDEKGKERKIDDPKRNYLAHNLNVFKDIFPTGDGTVETLGDRLIKYAQENNMKDIPKFVKENAEAIGIRINNYFVDYATELQRGDIHASMKNFSEDQKKVVKSTMNLYQNASSDQSAQGIETTQKISEAVEITGEKSAHEGLREITFQGKDSGLAVAAAVFAANQFILNVEYHNWFMGDNYLFTNPFKRGKVVTNTGKNAILSANDNSMLNSMRGESMHSLLTGINKPKDFTMLKTSVLKDAVASSKYFDDMINNIIQWERAMGNVAKDVDERKAELKESFKAYKKISTADGQTYIGLDAYRTLRIIYGNWENKDENEYRRQLALVRLHNDLYFHWDGDKQKAMTSEEKTAAIEADRKFVKSGTKKDGSYSEFNPQKFSYTGPEVLKDKDGNVLNSPLRTKFEKTSFAPLIPEMLMGSGTPNEEMMYAMANADIDYVKFESASKAVKHGDIVNYFDNDLKKIDGVNLEDHEYENLITSFLKHQLSTDGMHNDNILGSQQRVMFFDIKYQPEVQNNPTVLAYLEKLEKKYLQSITDMMAYQRAKFLNEYGMKESGEGRSYNIDIVDERRFSAAINSLAKKNNFPQNMMEYLKYDKNGKYTYDPSLVFNRKMLIDALGGVIDSELRRLRVKGTAAIQVSQAGTSISKLRNATEEETIKYGGSAGLHYYTLIKDDKGEIVRTSTMGIKITMQGDFLNLYNAKWRGEKIKNLNTLNAAMKDKAWKKSNIDKLTMVGYRIPTSNNNFIDHAEIMEFLPESSGNIVIAPMEHIIKSGSDFDVDKMNLIFPSIDNDGDLVSLEKVTYVEEFDKKARKMNTRAVVSKTKPIEQIYRELNAITDSVSDYNKRQKQINNFVNRANKQYKEISAFRDIIGMRIRDFFFNQDSVVYTKMEFDGAPFSEMVDYFSPFIITNDLAAQDLKDYNTLGKELVKSDGTIADSKVDIKFKNLLHELKSYKDYYTNQMLSTMKETLSHPSYYKVMVTPSNADYLMAQANRIGELTGRKTNDNLSSSENTKSTVVTSIHNNFMKEGTNLGIYSIMRRWFSLINYSKMHLNRDWTYAPSPTSEKAPMRIYMPLADVNQKNDMGANQNIVNLYGQNMDNMSINDIWDQFMTMTIDLPSNTDYTLFGVNNQNKRVSLYLTLSRYSIPMIMSFINQPILQEVYDLYQQKSKDEKGYMLKHALIKVANNYGIKEGGFADLYEDAYVTDEETGKPIEPSPFVKNPGIAANALLGKKGFDNTEFTQKEMDNDIKEYTAMKKANLRTSPYIKSDDYLNRQKNILLYFMSVSLEAANFSKMQFAFSEDRNKNTNYFTIQDNEAAKEDIRGSEYDDRPIDNSMFSKDALQKIEGDSIYTPFKYSRVAEMVYEKYAEEFTSLSVKTAIRSLLNNTSTFGTERQLLATRIEGDYIEMVYKNFGKLNTQIYDPFTRTLSDPPYKDEQNAYSKYFLHSIFNGAKDPDHKSYADRFSRFLENYPELKTIQFIKHLSPEGGLGQNRKDNDYLNELDGYDFSVMRFKRSSENTISERNFFAGELQNLMAFNPSYFRLKDKYSIDDVAAISAFFNEIAYLTLYQAGPTNIADNFSDLLPATFWQEFSSQAFEKMHVSLKDSVQKAEFMKLFSMMYQENNPKVPWRSNRMIYNLTYYGERLDDPKVRKLARRYTYNTEYFINFRAGKNYMLANIAKKANYGGIKDINC